MKILHPNLLLILNVNVLCMTTLPVISVHANGGTINVNHAGWRW
jgi:hypothetical protein